MRSTIPIPGNPWPHDMGIEVQSPYQLQELLWVREAWALDTSGDDLPPALADTPMRAEPGARPAEELREWADAWPTLWRDAVAHAGISTDRSVHDALMRTANGSAERWALLERIHGPSWRGRFGDEAFTANFSSWSAGLRAQGVASHRVPLDEQPERVALDALIPAWRAGPTKIVTIPCTGDYTRIIGAHALLVTKATRSDPARYRAALDAFG